MTSYNYAIIKHNYPELEREAVLLNNNYDRKKKYAFIQKACHKDGSESINFIEYSDDLEGLQKRAAGFKSWYNYPIGIAKSMQGYLSEI